MRSVFTSVVVLGAAVWVMGCPDRREVPHHLEIGRPTDEITIEITVDQTTGAPMIVIEPELPVFENPSSTRKLELVAKNPGNRWKTVAVTQFKETNPSDPASPKKGKPNTRCSDLTAPAEPPATRCQVAFPPESPDGVTVYKYNIVLYDGNGQPELVIDPVAIVKK